MVIAGIDTGFLAWDKIILLECQTCIRYVIVLATSYIIFIGIGLTNKVQKELRIELQLAG